MHYSHKIIELIKFPENHARSCKLKSRTRNLSMCKISLLTNNCLFCIFNERCPNVGLNLGSLLLGRVGKLLSTIHF